MGVTGSYNYKCNFCGKEIPQASFYIADNYNDGVLCHGDFEYILIHQNQHIISLLSKLEFKKEMLSIE